MDRHHMQVIQQFQLELSEARESAGKYKDNQQVNPANSMDSSSYNANQINVKDDIKSNALLGFTSDASVDGTTAYISTPNTSSKLRNAALTSPKVDFWQEPVSSTDCKLWVEPTLEDFDMIRGVWFIGGVPLRIFKWTPYFSYTAESSVVPVWIRFPDLPIHMFSKVTLFSAASIIGKPIKIDEATADCSRLSVARVCVEIDLLKPKIEDFWIGIGEEKRLQRVEFEKHPSFCVQCLHLGHSVEECYASGSNAKSAGWGPALGP
ncbi:hypothetical protein ZIOFF_059360 [Zingiber officinale]|uniref:DUF4283 domain-containing protein n=1 Tax=Zingiber officinale TaxID=94328 RepID=A0A8J5F9D2_ZINOF|nr:hypothetical protein ZIOFF_059360 [Zingiber officinale]